MKAVSSHAGGMQFFGQVDIDGKTGEFRVQLKDIDGTPLFTQVLTPA
jgi:alkaline phosphatase D